MIRHFGSLMEMAMFMATRPAEVAIELEHGLDRLLGKMEATARSEFGHYQDEVGGFPGWPELADATKDDRVAKGFPENEPLLRTGETRDSFSHERHGLEGAMGSTDEKMPWFEFGTDRMPARPVVGPAAYRNKEVAQQLVGAALMVGLVGASGAGPAAEIHAALGYNLATKD